MDLCSSQAHGHKTPESRAQQTGASVMTYALIAVCWIAAGVMVARIVGNRLG
jgi:hypothetical protein